MNKYSKRSPREITRKGFEPNKKNLPKNFYVEKKQNMVPERIHRTVILMRLRSCQGQPPGRC